MVPLNVDFPELYKIQQFLSRFSLERGLQVLLEKAHFPAKYSRLGVGSAPGGCSGDPNPHPHPWGACHSDEQDSVWGSESKSLQFVIPKPAKWLKSRLQFGMSVKYVFFSFGRWCHFGISIIPLRVFIYLCVCVCLKQLQNPICCTALTCKWIMP